MYKHVIIPILFLGLSFWCSCSGKTATALGSDKQEIETVREEISTEQNVRRLSDKSSAGTISNENISLPGRDTSVIQKNGFK